MVDKPAQTSDLSIAQSIDQDRRDLAAALRLAAHFDFHEGICNHFSVQCEGGDELYLINAYGVHWSKMTVDHLLLIDGEGNVVAGDREVEPAARFIHIAGHRANPDHKVIMHVHTPYATALTMLENGRLQWAHQTACRFYGRIGYEHAYGGIAFTEDEGERLAGTQKADQNIDVMFLANHGVVVAGASVARAFDDLYYLERACRQQVLAMSTGEKLRLLPENVVRQTAEQMMHDADHYAIPHFEALKKVIGMD